MESRRMGSVTVREDPARTVAYLRMKGPYATMPDGLRKLYGYLEANRLTPAGPPVGVYFTDPRKVPQAEARWELQWPIVEHSPDRDPDGDGIGIRSLECRNLAVLIHTGPYDTIGATYSYAEAWIGDHGYKVIGPFEEAYLSEPDTPPEKIRTEIRLPVAHQPVSYAA